jgi:uncharacterized oligopeptide transporter (OPT) family protein
MSSQPFRPYVPADRQMREFTLRAVILGLIMTVVLGAANMYLGLRAGMTIAATYPAAVIGMALLKLVKGSLLEENMARTIGSIGESVAAGATFTIPAFVISGMWPALGADNYWQGVALMMVGGTLGILFVTLLRRVMVEDPELPFPESIAASQIHKAGQQGSRAAKILFANMGIGAAVFFAGAINIFDASKEILVNIPALSFGLKLGRAKTAPTSASATSSDRVWPPSTSPEACWPGDSWFRSSPISSVRRSPPTPQVPEPPSTGPRSPTASGSPSSVPSLSAA